MPKSKNYLYRTVRREVKEVLGRISSAAAIDSDLSNITNDLNESFQNVDNIIIESSSDLGNDSISQNFENVIESNDNTSHNSFPENINNENESNEGTSSENPCFSVINSSDTEESEISDIIDESFLTTSFTERTTSSTDLLRNWAVDHKINHVALKDLLQILSKSDSIEFQKLPKDPRSFLKTPRNIVTRVVLPGSYCHIGIRCAIEEHYKSLNQSPTSSCVEIAVNIDGLPLAKSSSSQVYPILGVIKTLNNKNNVVLVGLYHGHEKPNDFNDFLSEFVSEAKYLTNNGITIIGKNFQFKITMFLFDAVAKSSVLFIKGHSGYSSCTKCLQEGEYISDRVCFPNLNFTKRSHEQFITQGDPEHHIGHTILSEIPGIDLIKDVPLDYMHLVCLGVVKRFLVLTWCYGKPPHKFSAAQIESISNKLLSFIKHIPSEFARLPRSLQECKRWKATEYRQFLLYTSPIALKNILSKTKYVHFLSLHVALTIMLSKKYFNVHINFADDLLNHFVKTTKIIYGPQFLTHNIHNLLHLADDVRRYGNLDNFSNFSSENFLQILKNMLRKPGDVIAQIVRRVREINANKIYTDESEKFSQFHMLNEHCLGPLIDNCCNPQYKTIVFSNFKLSIDSVANSCCVLKNNTIIEIKNFAYCQTTNDFVVIGCSYKEKNDFYNIPCPSSLLDIYFVKDIEENINAWPVTEIEGKLIKLPYSDGYVVYPFLHSD